MGGADFKYWPKDWSIRSHIPHRNTNRVRGFRDYLLWYTIIGVIGYNTIYRWEMRRVKTYRVPRRAHFMQKHQLHLDEEDPTYHKKYKTGQRVFVF